MKIWDKEYTPSPTHLGRCRRIAKYLARESGGEIEILDFGHTIQVRNGDKTVRVRDVFRPPRDAMTGVLAISNCEIQKALEHLK